MARRANVPSIDMLKLRCKIDKQTGCWLWTMQMAVKGYDNKYSYPVMRVDGDTKSVTRTMYRLHYKEMLSADTMVVMSCGDNRCINPDHMQLIRGKAMMKKLYTRRRDQREMAGEPVKPAPSADKMKPRARQKTNS